MTAYSALSDAELVRKVQELMGYVLDVQHVPGEAYFYELYLNDTPVQSSFSSTEAEAWSHAPDPLTDANVTMALVDEIKQYYFRTKIIVNDHLSDVYIIGEKRCGHDEVIPNDVFSAPTIARAVCEVYCQVKEGKE